MEPWLDLELKYNSHGRPTTHNEAAKLPFISTDTDGVLANWVDGFLGVFNTKFGTSITHDQWVNDEPWKADPPLMTKKQFEEAFEETLKVPDFYLKLKPYPAVNFELINKDLEAAMYNLFVITNRVNLLTEEGIQDTTQLLSRWVWAQGVTRVTGCHAGAADRAKLLEQLGVEFHLDDFHLNVEKINKHGKTKAFLMDRPWNRQYDVGDLRCISFEEFLLKSVFADREVRLEAV